MSKQELLKKAREFVLMLEKEVASEKTPEEWSENWDKFSKLPAYGGFVNYNVSFSKESDRDNFNEHQLASLEWNSRARHANALAGWEEVWLNRDILLYSPELCRLYEKFNVRSCYATQVWPFSQVHSKESCQAIIDAMGPKKMKALFNIFDEGE